MQRVLPLVHGRASLCYYVDNDKRRLPGGRRRSLSRHSHTLHTHGMKAIHIDDNMEEQEKICRDKQDITSVSQNTTAILTTRRDIDRHANWECKCCREYVAKYYAGTANTQETLLIDVRGQSVSKLQTTPRS